MNIVSVTNELQDGETHFATLLSITSSSSSNFSTDKVMSLTSGESAGGVGGWLSLLGALARSVMCAVKTVSRVVKSVLCGKRRRCGACSARRRSLFRVGRFLFRASRFM